MKCIAKTRIRSITYSLNHAITQIVQLVSNHETKYFNDTPDYYVQEELRRVKTLLDISKGMIMQLDMSCTKSTLDIHRLEPPSKFTFGSDGRFYKNERKQFSAPASAVAN